MNKIKIGIIGATGYTGIELLKVLSRHPNADIKFVGANSSYGSYINEQFCNLELSNKLKIKKNIDILKIKKIDLIFSCLPNGELIAIYNKLKKLNAKIIDLSGDFRLNDKSHRKWYATNRKKDIFKEFQYILPEINKQKLKNNKNISNPGCYATSIILGLFPIVHTLKNQDTIIVDTKSGISGAGKSHNLEHSFTESAENLSTYKVGEHRHSPEIEQLVYKEFKKRLSVIMVPHLLPIKRGIMSNIYLTKNAGFNEDKVYSLFKNYYLDSKFIKISKSKLPKISDVQNTNYCSIGLKVFPNKKTLLICSVIDNLGKGASSQAVQNMNLLFNFDENLGL